MLLAAPDDWLHGIPNDGLPLTGGPDDGYRGQPRDNTAMNVIKNCPNCGGEHWGSVRCPFTPEELKRMTFPDRAATDAADHARIEQEFIYHSPHDDQPARYEALRTMARNFAHAIVNMVPPCADRTAALRKLRECVFTANAAIAIQEAVMPAAQSGDDATKARVANATHPRAGGEPQPGGGPREL